MAPDTNASSIERRLTDEVRDAIRRLIEEYDGAEIFFVGHLNDKRMVEEVEPLAYGNQNAVPAIEGVARPGDVVIHNHPSGNLEPSEADMSIAARLGNDTIGAYIIDNACERLRIVVEVREPRKRQLLRASRLEELLGPTGPIADAMGDAYEHRREQVEMLDAVVNAFNDDGIAVVEAGTGVGKSLAYLLPAIQWATLNGEKVVVSTNTINLQEQLIQKDLPFLKKHLDIEFKAELMKGRGNYLCRRKAAYLQRQPDFFGDEQTVSELQAILGWADKTQDGSLSDLAFVPDYETWESVACDGDNCPRIKCEFYNRCFFYNARQRVSMADIIVANHHLLMADLEVRREMDNYTSTAVLPAYKRVILDEAHNVEDVATQYFGIRISRRSFDRSLGRLVRRDRQNLGLLPFVRDQLIAINFRNPTKAVDDAVQRITEELIPLRMDLARALQDLLDRAAEAVSQIADPRASQGRETHLRITESVEQTPYWTRTLHTDIGAASDMINRLVAGLRSVRTAMRKIPDQKAREDLDNPAGEIQSISNRLESRAQQLQRFYHVGENQCRWIEVVRLSGRRPPIVRLVSLPLEVQSDLNHAVYRRVGTVVMTSATLTVEDRFDFFLDRIGLGEQHADPDTRERIERLHLDTPFDFRKQALVGVPIDMPDPREGAFTETAIEFLLPALQLSRGSAFVLFTSYSQLRQVHERMAPQLRPLGYSCLRQGDESRRALLMRFKNDPTSILFATASFWEGVDVPGDALKLLVIAKLPFRVPTDPLMQARAERLEALGIDSFNNYALPTAVIRFKQGFGRLIRTRDDYGAVLVLDKRIATQRYGQTFLNSLPIDEAHRKPGVELLDDLRAFFDNLAEHRRQTAQTASRQP